jgi:DNA-binding transcriptional ArsR family regulator
MLQASSYLHISAMAERPDHDVLFKALADPSRRKLLDLLHAHDGRTLNELCEYLEMTRQGVRQQTWSLPSGAAALGTETTTGEKQWLDRASST